ncbi:hypothetical protein O9K51_10685 [Purpureocillium lavendulum]|uniref:Uncharacterized protein n=1 Tax=Purpureocillium lavendulum TaxID=1247861 RepID=A0AB34FEA4_9HYPO|nr:hypothetical protein O9K51_10685 [Purpureocillium lavendulum]
MQHFQSLRASKKAIQKRGYLASASFKVGLYKEGSSNPVTELFALASGYENREAHEDLISEKPGHMPRLRVRGV